MRAAQPEFVALTGVDRLECAPDLKDISNAFPNRVEFGVLVCKERFGTPRFPTLKTIKALARSGLRVSAHICGHDAERIFSGSDIDFDLSGFSRAQINLLHRHAASHEIENAIRFGKTRGIRVIVQCAESYPAESRCDWLLDNSFGEGRLLGHVPDMSGTQAFCGISGGLSPENIGAILQRAAPACAGRPFWIDAETALMKGGAFSPDACRAFLGEVFG